jgi:hypothetical protein
MARLVYIKLENFKGAASFEASIDSQIVTFYGSNEAGKTRLKEAFEWLFFGVQHEEIKTITNCVVDRVTPAIVEAVMSFDDSIHSFKKICSDKWVKKRNSLEKEYAGTTNEYFIDGVSLTEKEYNDRLFSITNKVTQQILSDPLFFLQELPWQKRREILFSLVKSNPDDLLKQPEWAELAAKVTTTVGDLKKVMADQKKRCEKRAGELTPSIAELKRMVTSIPDEATVQAELSTLQKEKQIAENQMQSPGVTLRSDLATVNAAIEAARFKQVQEINVSLESTFTEQRAAKRDMDILSLEIEFFEGTSLVSNEQMVKQKEAKLQSLREDWKRINSFMFNGTSLHCPTCKKPYDATEIEAMKKTFNTDKSLKLESIAEQGQKLSSEIAGIKENIAQLFKDIAAQKEKRSSLLSTWGAVSQQIVQLEQAKLSCETAVPPDLLLKKQSIEADLAVMPDNTELKEKVVEYDIEISALYQVLASIKVVKGAQARIIELEAEQKIVSFDYCAAEKILLLIDKFTVARVTGVQEAVDKEFKYARWKLFDVQKNGVVDDCCEAVYKGRPFPNLSKGARKNLGMDIINRLSIYYNWTMPVWVDDMEGLSSIILTPSQQIRLVVKKDCPKLEVVLG